METIDIKEMLEYFKNKISIIILITAVVGILGCLYGMFIQVPKYTSSTSIVLISSTSSESSLTYSDISLNQNLVSTYSEIIKSKRILNRVRENLDLNISYGELNSFVNVSSVTGTQIIKVSVTTTDNAKAALIADEIANVFAEEIPDLYNISNVNILDTAEVSENPSNINLVKQTVLFILVGLVLGLGIVFVLYYFDRSIKTKEQIEKLGLPILGTIQELKGGK